MSRNKRVTKSIRDHTIIWLFGENVGKTANNNSFFCWLHFLECDDNIDKYFVLEDNPQNKRILSTLSNRARQFVVWRNSIDHYLLYQNTNLAFVTLSYLDVVPDQLFGKKTKWYAQFPLVYLQHGLTGQKKLGYTGYSYNNNMFRFVYYNRNIKEKLVSENNFLPSQLYYGIFQPRYQQLVARYRHYQSMKEHGGASKEILWFLTWREYKSQSIEEIKFQSILQSSISSKRLKSYLTHSNASLCIVLHRQMIGNLSESIGISSDSNIKLIDGGSIDILEKLASADLLITDYSSVAYDFAFLDKPVILFTPDRADYEKNREFYSTEDDYEGFRFDRFSDLMECLENDDYSVPRFFRDAFPRTINYDKIESGDYIQRMYEYFLNIQRNAVAFIGYNFWGAGGTVTATKALAEALTAQGLMVSMVSLKGKSRSPLGPRGVRYRSFYRYGSKSRIEKAKRLLYRNRKYLKPIEYDESIDNLIPYSGYALQQYLDYSKDAVIVSTRDSFHSALYSSNFTGKKLYFWHTAADSIDSIFPNLLPSLMGKDFDGSLFTTINNREGIKELGISIGSNIILGNTLLSENILSETNLTLFRKEKLNNREAVVLDYSDALGLSPDNINCISLIRFSKDRKSLLEKMIEFGLLVRARGSRIVLYIFGDGELLNSFIEEVYSKELENILIVKGKTSRPTEIIQPFDFMIDFADQQSFGMTTLEAIFNGCMPLCTINKGSVEILGVNSKCFYSSIDELLDKLSIEFATDEHLFNDVYRSIKERYSPEVLANSFMNFCGIACFDQDEL